MAETARTEFDSRLIEGARAGEPAAWEHIVSELGPVIRGYARARGVRDPDDVMQDVFVAAASRIGGFEGDGDAFRSWLFGIAYRQIVNRHRRAAREPGPLPASLPGSTATPEEEVIDRLQGAAAVAALDALGELERDVVLMRVLGGLDTDAVAHAVGRRPGNVRVIQSRALAKLRAELARRGYDGAGHEPVKEAG
jgi:RNA polymerase sigma-70 factor (ECF subfamily)